MANPDVRLRAATKGDGEQYYEYMQMYVDDILALSCNARLFADVQKTFLLKNDKIGPPEFYLGAKLQQKLVNRMRCWKMTSQDYVKAAFKQEKASGYGQR
jgi:hypothetical protein